MPLLGPLPRPAWFGYGLQLGYIVAARLVSMALANALMWSGTVFYPDYAAGQAARGIDPLVDQSIGGVVMATEGFVVTFLLFAWVFLRAAKEGEESQRLVDEAETMGISLDPRRAARAVAAGRGEELRERLLSEGERKLSGPGPA
jgi:putative membrane protein